MYSDHRLLVVHFSLYGSVIITASPEQSRPLSVRRSSRAETLGHDRAIRSSAVGTCVPGLRADEFERRLTPSAGRRDDTKRLRTRHTRSRWTRTNESQECDVGLYCDPLSYLSNVK